MRGRIQGSLKIALGALIVTLALTAGPQDRALELFRATDYPGAIAILRDAKDARGLELLGRSYLAEGDYRRATETLERAVALEPSNSMMYTWLARAYGHRAETSFALNAAHNANRTRECFERAIELDPSNRSALGDLFDFYLQAPAVVGGGVDKAKALLPQIARYDPVGHELDEASLAEHAKQFDKAEQHLHRAIEIGPRDADPQSKLQVSLAKFLARRARFEESEQVFRRAAEINPLCPRLDFDRAETYIQTRRNPAEARDLLRKYLAARNLTPEDPARHDALRLLKKVEGT